MARGWDRDFYRILGVAPTSSPAEIRKRYHECMNVVHPDKNTTDTDIRTSSERLAQAYNEAYAVLSDPASRAEYDRWWAGNNQPSPPPPDRGEAAEEARKRAEAEARQAAEEARKQAQDEARRAAEEARREAARKERELAEELARQRAEQRQRETMDPARRWAAGQAWAHAMLQPDPSARAWAKANPGAAAEPINVTVQPGIARDGGPVAWATPCEECEGRVAEAAAEPSVCVWCGGSGSQRVVLHVPASVTDGSVHEAVRVAIGGVQTTARIRFVVVGSAGARPTDQQAADRTPSDTEPVGRVAQGAHLTDVQPHPVSPRARRNSLLPVLALVLVGVVLLGGWLWNSRGSSAQAPPGAGNSTTSSPSSTAAGYSRYANPRFGFAVDVPGDWEVEQESGDGIVQSSPDRLGALTLFGANNLDATTIEDALAAAKAAKVAEGARVTLAARSDSYFTVSGFSAAGDEIFYTGQWVGPGSTNSLTFTYPADQRQQYDDLVNHVVDSFAPGDLDQAH